MDVFARGLKVLMVALLALLLAVINLSVAALLVFKYVDWSKHEDALIGAVEYFTDWKVEQLGSVGIELFFPTVVTAENVELSQTTPPSALSSVSAKQFKISFDPLSPFFDERLLIHDIELSGARIVARAAQGSPEPAKPPKAASPLPIPAIESAQIRDSNLVYKSGSGKRDLSVHVANLEMAPASAGNGAVLDGRGTVENMNFTVNGSLGSLQKLDDAQTPLPIDLKISVADDQLAVQGQAELNKPVLTFDLNTSFQGDSLGRIGRAFGYSLGDIPDYAGSASISKSPSRVALDQITLTVGKSQLSGNAALDLDQPKPRLTGNLDASLLRRKDIASLFPGSRTRNGGEARQGTVKSSPARSSSETARNLSVLNEFSANMSVSVEEYRGEALGGVINAASFDVTVDEGQAEIAGQLQAGLGEGQLDVNLEGALGPVAEPGEKPEPIPFTVSVSALGDSLHIEGHVRPGSDIEADVTVSAKGDSLGQLAGTAGIALSDVPAYEAQFSAHLADQTIDVQDLSLSLGQSFVSGSASVDLGQATPRFNADLDSSLLRRQDLLSLIPEGDNGKQQRQSPAQGLSLGFLHEFGADVSLSVAEYRGEALGPILSSADLVAELNKGSVTVSGQATAESLTFDVEGSLGPPAEPGAEPQPVPFKLQVTALDDTVTADGNILPGKDDRLMKFQLTARGNSLSRIASAFGKPLGDVPAYKASLSAVIFSDRIRAEDLDMTLGYSHVYGNATLHLDSPQPQLRADLGASMLRRTDIVSLIPQDQPEEQDDSEDEPLSLDFLSSLDADVDIAIAKYRGEALGGPVTGGKLNINLGDSRVGLSGYFSARETEVDVEASLGPAQPETGPLPFTVEVGIAGDTLTLAGKLAIDSDAPLVTADGALEGDSLSEVAGLFGASLGDVGTYQGHFSGTASKERIALKNIQLAVGESQILGNARLQLNDDRPYLHADLKVPVLYQSDVAALFPPGEASTPQEPRDQPAKDGPVFPRSPVPLEWMHVLDLDLKLDVEHFRGPRLGVFEALALQVTLDNGKLTIDPFRFGLADGNFESRLVLSDRATPAELHTSIEATDIDLRNLFAAITGGTDQQQSARGELRAYLEAHTSGNTPNEWASRVDGELGFVIDDGALPAVLVEAIGLDFTEAVVSGIGENTLTDIHCGVGAFNINNGMMRTQALVISSNDSNIVGSGHINLAQEVVDYRLEAIAKDFSVFASDSPVEITGPLDDLEIGLGSYELAATTVTAAALALINPLFSAIPFTELGLAEEGRCKDLKAQLRNIRADISVQ